MTDYATEITGRIERMDALEDRLCCSFEALYAVHWYNGNDGWLRVNLDVLTPDGELDSNIKVIASAYNAAGQLIATDGRIVYKNDFFGIESLSLLLGCPEVPHRIRIYPGKY